MSNLEWALKYLALGWSVIPCHTIKNGHCTCKKGAKCKDPGKHPRVGWTEFQTRRPTKEEVIAWWTKWPRAGVGLVCGKISGLMVVDLDNHGVNGVETLRAKKLILPLSVRSETGSGGFHYFLQWPGYEVKNFTQGNKLLPGVDFRGDGGFIVLPPSSHISGGSYLWVEGPEGELKPAPEWLLDLIKKQGPYKCTGSSRKCSTDQSKTSGRKNSDGWVNELLMGVAEGSRNDSAAKLAGWYFRKFEGDKDQVEMVMKTWNQRNNPPLEDDALMKVIESIGSRAGVVELGSELGIDIEKIRAHQSFEGKSKFEFFFEGIKGSINFTSEEVLSHRKFRAKVLDLTLVRGLTPMKDAIWIPLLNAALAEAEIVPISQDATDVGFLKDILRSNMQHPDDQLTGIDRGVIVKNGNIYVKMLVLQEYLKDYEKLKREKIADTLKMIGFKEIRVWDENRLQHRLWRVSKEKFDEEKEKVDEEKES